MMKWMISYRYIRFQLNTHTGNLEGQYMPQERMTVIDQHPVDFVPEGHRKLKILREKSDAIEAGQPYDGGLRGCETVELIYSAIRLTEDQEFLDDDILERIG